MQQKGHRIFTLVIEDDAVDDEDAAVVTMVRSAGAAVTNDLACAKVNEDATEATVDAAVDDDAAIVTTLRGAVAVVVETVINDLDGANVKEDAIVVVTAGTTIDADEEALEHVIDNSVLSAVVAAESVADATLEVEEKETAVAISLVVPFESSSPSRRSFWPQVAVVLSEVVPRSSMIGFSSSMISGGLG